MKKSILALVVIVVLAVIFFVSGKGKKGQDETAKSAKTAAAHKPHLDLNELPPPKQGKQQINPQLRALLLAAIAQNVAKAQAPQHEEDAGAKDASIEDAAQAHKPLSRRRKIMKFQRATRRLLGPIAFDCLKQYATKETQAIGQDKKVVMNLQGTEAEGSLVTHLQIFDAHGPVQAPAMQQCMEDRAYKLRLPAPPIAKGKTSMDSSFSFPLFIPSGNE